MEPCGRSGRKCPVLGFIGYVLLYCVYVFIVQYICCEDEYNLWHLDAIFRLSPSAWHGWATNVLCWPPKVSEAKAASLMMTHGRVETLLLEYIIITKTTTT